MLDPKCKKCRRVGEKLFLKGERCFSQKCAMIRKPYRPGLHGKSRRRRRLSEYGQQLIEKQKVRLLYGVSEKQFKNYVKATAPKKVNHGHILVNQRKLDIPSYQVKKGDQIQIKEKIKKSPIFKDLKTILNKYEAPSWLGLDKEKPEGQVLALPKTEDVGKVGEMGMIIEFYSR